MIKLLFTLVCLSPGLILADDNLFSRLQTPYLQDLGQDIKSDFRNQFSTDQISKLGDFLITGGILANTGLDRSLGNSWQNKIRSKKRDRFFKLPNAIAGAGIASLGIYLSGQYIGHKSEYRFSQPLQFWSNYCFRSALLGGVQQAGLTAFLGSPRPGLGADSRWTPFRHNTGVSGHTFYGAVPFLVAAKMSKPKLVKSLLYGLSILPGLARINKNKNYTSQVLIAYGLSIISVNSVFKTEEEPRDDSNRVRFAFHAAPNRATLSAKFVY